ncbi:cysteine-rich receptor-like protein kinase 19 [Prosopis cineraria]|uniref:cysteine-rich receptor-like protein kinase 19 n=1 Tax=Prosopis cineraria TaxID=364024 RepID=UPI00240ECA88|nr:cysteine-rich receptor-like protein kinase 19 [Prosopis cineraria]
MASTLFFLLFSIFLHLHFDSSNSQSWIKAGYWYVGSESPIPDINSALFSHLICAFATVNPSTYELSIAKSDQQYFSTFTNIVKRKNPSIVTLISVWNGQPETAQGILGKKANHSVLSSMLRNDSSRKSFIQSSIQTARRHGFQGIDLFWLWPQAESDMTNLGILLHEWRLAVDSENRSSGESSLVLSMGLHYLPTVFGNLSYPVDSLARNLNWGHILAYDYHLPSLENFTHPHAALYDPVSHVNTDFGVRQWLSRGFPSNKLLLGLPYHGYAWALDSSKETAIGAPSSGVAETQDGSMSYKYIKLYVRSYGAPTLYNATYVVNYCTIGSVWINFDDVEAIRTKVAYAKEKKLLGYNVFQVINDDNWALSEAAQEEETDRGNKRRLLLIILLPVAIIIITLVFLLCCFRSKSFKSKVKKVFGKSSKGPMSNAESLETSAPHLEEFSFAIIRAATNDFSVENKLGEGGFGPVYKGKLPGGQEIAVKRLSMASTQGHEEFTNEVSLTARLQHVNLASVLGFCIEREEKMLIYQYMPNRSLDFYLYDPIRKNLLDWGKRVHIIEGIIQGLLYLQEYSNLTIIHRDLKASNILLDDKMNPKISDFGMAKLFRKDEVEANTGRIVGTYGYVPPEYVRKGTYSMKYDVYSFGVLLLQIISGKRNNCYYGADENLSILEYAYNTWKEGKGLEFVDPSREDSSSSCKLLQCLHVALLCVQENPVERPTMLEVSSMLKNEAEAIPLPKRPAFSTKSDEKLEDRSSSTSQQASCSINDASISQIMAR